MDEGAVLELNQPSPESSESLPPPGAAHFAIKKWEVFAALVALAVLGGILIWYRVYFGGPLVRPYAEAYQLVPDKISESAAIAIRLPKGVAKEEGQAAITFNPPIEGMWVASDAKDILLFKPNNKIELGKYYSIALDAPGAKISKDFLADEDPKVTAVFPNAATEAPENSEITIVFNRPMVPLTTLDELTDKNIPVEIAPKTSGKFKWTTTRNLQFIPSKRLFRASRYTVKINSGFVSMDGLKVEGLTHNFTTRPLRYEYSSSGAILYDRPIVIAFNQPFDLERTKKEIRVIKSGANDAVAFSASYGIRSRIDPDTRKKSEVVDRSILEIFGARDRFGRKKFWDANTRYHFELARAYPLEGDIALEESRAGDIQVPEIIDNLSAESPRSRHVRPESFDPQGKIWVTFFEEIDKDRSHISAPRMKEIGYGEKCRTDEDGNVIYLDNGCEKITDYKKISITFDGAKLKPGEAVPISFQAVVNRDRLTLNGETITKTVTVYPELSIIRTVPGNGDSDAKLTELKICSNNPLTPADENNFGERVKSNLTVGLWNWYEPFRVSIPGDENSPFGKGYYGASPFGGSGTQVSPCKAGEFENTIRYGLIPASDYRLNLNLVDDFGQSASSNIAFRTGAVPDISRNLFNLQKRYNVTSPDRTKLTYAAENFEYVNMDICEVSAEAMLGYVQGFPDAALPPSALNCSRRISKRIELPQRFWVRNYFQINLHDYIGDSLGHFIVSLSHPSYYRQSWTYKGVTSGTSPVYERTFVTVTRLAVQEKKVEWNTGEYYRDSNADVVRNALEGSRQNLYWVTEFASLNSIVGANIDLYQKGMARASSALTDGQGVARLDPVQNLIGAVIKSGVDSAIVSANVDKLQWASPAYSAERTYIYTDRPIYRPGQEVFVKGLHRIGYDGNYEIFRGKKAEVKISNSRGETVFTKELDISDYGTFNTGFILDAKSPLGSYYIQALGGYASFDVEEYVPSPFKVETKTDKDEYIAGETAKLAIDASYYFGVAVERGEVSYSVLSQDYYFDRYSDGYFNFGGGWYYSYGGYYGDKYIARGKTNLDANGHGEVDLALDFGKYFKDEEKQKSKIFVVRLTAKNSNGESVSAEKSFIVHRGEFYLGVNLERTFLAKGGKAQIKVKSVDTQGKETRVSGITLEVNKIKWESFKRREVDGRYYYRTEKKKENIKKETLSTDSHGNASYELVMDKEGEYEVTVRAGDNRSNPIEATQDFYVSGSSSVVIRPTNNETLDLATDKNKVGVGDRVKVIIKSPYQKAKALVALERGKIFSYDIVDVTSNLAEYSFEVKEEHLPNVYLTVLLLSPRPEIKYGQINYEVNTKHAELKVDVKTDKSFYLPGEKIRLNVETRDWQNNPVSAEVSVAVADVSVLALKGNPKKNPVLFFYGGMPLVVSTASNVKNILYEAEIPIGTKGGGGGEPDDLAKKKRGEFKDTSFWKAVLRTGPDGRAEATFTLPDNLTTWQVETVGITEDTKLGVGYKEFATKKELMVVPLKPRFIVPGDEFSIGAKVFNETNDKQKLDVMLKSDTLETKGKNSQAVTIDSHTNTTVYFRVKAPESKQDGRHTFVLSAKNSGYDDTVEQNIGITRNNTYEAQATANYTADLQASEYFYIPANVTQDRGGVTIKASATLAVYLSDALNYLVGYPYGCSEQIASKLSSIAIVKRSLDLKNIGDKFDLRDVEFEGGRYSVDDVVKIGLTRIYENQTPEGGFTYYQGLTPSFYLTLHVVDALVNLKRAGYDINNDALNRAARFLANEITANPNLYRDKDTVILVTYTLSRVEGFSGYADLKNRTIALAGDKKFISEDISSTSLGYLAILLSRGYPESLKNEVYKTLENRIDIDSRGAHLKARGRVLYSYYETPIKDTALLLKAVVADRRDNPVNDKIMRWLLASRAKDGAWGSTNNTVAVVDAMADFLEWKRENESEFALKINLDDRERGKFDFGRDSILKTFESFIPVGDLGLEKISHLVFQKENKNSLPNSFYYDASLKYYLKIDQIPPRDEGFAVTREFYKLDDVGFKKPLAEAGQGDVLRGRLVITVPQARNFVSIEDFIPAGMELVNFNLATEDKTLTEYQQKKEKYYRGFIEEDDDFSAGARQVNLFADAARFARLAEDGESRRTEALAKRVGGTKSLLAFLGFSFSNWWGPSYADDEEIQSSPLIQFYPDANETHDDRLFLFKERVEPGVYEYNYYVRALIPGNYHHLPAIASEMYFPENFGRTRGEYFKVISD